MKKIVLFILLIFACFYASAQTKEPLCYHLEAFLDSYDIKIQNYNGSYFEFRIDCPTFDGREAGLILRKPDVASFIGNLKKVKEIFENWGKIAKENKVIDYMKMMDVEFNPIKVFFLYGDTYHYSYNTKLYPVFRISEQGTPMASILTAELEAQDNEFITAKGISIVFLSSIEIDILISKLNVEAVMSERKPKSELEELFK